MEPSVVKEERQTLFYKFKEISTEIGSLGNMFQNPIQQLTEKGLEAWMKEVNTAADKLSKEIALAEIFLNSIVSMNIKPRSG